MDKIKGFWQILKDAGAGFSRHKVPKLSASLAYYTIFSIGPMMLVIIFFSNLFWGKDAIEGTIYNKISGVVGDAAALQIQEIIKNASVSGNNFMAVIGFITLIIAATTAFSEMQDSINMIWNLRVKEGSGFLQTLKNRLMSFSMVAGLGFLLLVSLIINSLLDGFMSKLQEMFPHVTVVVVYLVNILLTLFVVSILFAIIFKFLPDAIIEWKDVAAGALFTAVLFMIGKFGITFYINKGDMGSTYGSAGSLVVLFLWVYYSSIILYFGAEFTKAYAMKYGSEIRPANYAVTVQIVQVESSEKSVQDNEKKIDITEKKLQKVKDEAREKSEMEQDRYRHLLIFGKDINEKKVKDQMTLLSREDSAVKDRDILITVVESNSNLFSKYNVDTHKFTVILVGKDGTEKLRKHDLLQPGELFATIDAMPMRKREMRRQ